MCGKEKCQRARSKLIEKIVDLNKQNETLIATLKEMTRRFRKLKQKTSSRPSSQVTIWVS